MGLLTAEAILGASDLTSEDVPCPEWGGTVRVRVLGAGERRAFEKRLGELPKDDSLDIRSLLVGMCAVGEDGTPLFSPEQLAALAKKSSVPIVRLFDRCKKLNCIGDEEDDASKKSPSQIPS